MSGRIRVGIGGWTYEPWRGPFYPEGHAKARELEYASRHVTAIEINGTYYGSQKPATWADWARRTPDDFVFAVKASRFCTNRRKLADGAGSIAKFLGQGLVELGPKLGPILWQFMPTKTFDAEDFAAFLDLLPPAQDGVALRHALEVRHESFRDNRFVALARRKGAAIVVADSARHPQIADPAADFVYARLQDAVLDEPAGYPPAALDRWAAVARDWAAGGAPPDLTYQTPPLPPGPARDAFLFFINGAKVRAPAAAQALLDRLGTS